jgi:hypothetical protein
VLGLIVLGGVGEAPTAHAQDAGAPHKVLRRTGFIDPQILATPHGTAYLLWAKKIGPGFDLFLSVREPGGHLGSARRVNETPASVQRETRDGLEPAMAAGPDGQVAVGWIDVENEVRLALFDPAASEFTRWTLDRPDGNPVRGYVALDFEERGALLAVWIDARRADPGESQPADLYGVRLADRRARPHERNLTGAWTESVCGNCPPAVRATDPGMEVLFRDVGEDGYRDVFRGAGSFREGLSTLARVGPPTVKSNECPTSGAITDGDLIFWRDASMTPARVVECSALATKLREVARGDDEWTITATPRLVSGVESTVLFVPGTPHARLYTRKGGQWKIISDEIPEWCKSIAWVENAFLMVGDEHTELRMETLSWRQ